MKKQKVEPIKIQLYLDKDGKSTKETKIFSLSPSKFKQYKDTVKRDLARGLDVSDASKQKLIEVMLAEPTRAGGGESSIVLDALRHSLTDKTLSVEVDGKKIDLLLKGHKSVMLAYKGKQIVSVLGFWNRSKDDKSVSKFLPEGVKPSDIIDLSPTQ